LIRKSVVLHFLFAKSSGMDFEVTFLKPNRLISKLNCYETSM